MGGTRVNVMSLPCQQMETTASGFLRARNRNIYIYFFHVYLQKQHILMC